MRGARASPEQVSIVHSSLDLYLCVGKLPAGTERIAVGLDPDLSADSAPGTGDYVFSFTSTGTVTAERGDPDGKLVPLPITAADASAAFAAGSAEVRISLEWLGGYARDGRPRPDRRRQGRRRPPALAGARPPRPLPGAGESWRWPRSMTRGPRPARSSSTAARAISWCPSRPS